MYKAWLAVAMMFVVASCSTSTDSDNATSEFDTFAAYSGFMDLYWDETGGRLLIRIKDLDTPFLYQSSLARGVGSNDLGLDRGQLGTAKMVSFARSGPKVLLIEHNLAYRARGDNENEKQAVEESFARSVIWGFEVLGSDDDAVVIDGTDFFLRDAHGIAWHRRATDRDRGRPVCRRCVTFRDLFATYQGVSRQHRSRSDGDVAWAGEWATPAYRDSR